MSSDTSPESSPQAGDATPTPERAPEKSPERPSTSGRWKMPIKSRDQEDADNGAPQDSAANQSAATNAESSGSEESPKKSAWRVPGSRFLLFQAVPSWAISMLVHVAILVVLGLFTFMPAAQNMINELLVGETLTEQESLEEIEPTEIEPIDTSLVVEADTASKIPSDVDPVEPVLTQATDLEAAAAKIELNQLAEMTAPANNELKELGAFTGSGIQGRGSAQRSAMLEQFGGNKASEDAVRNALLWIAGHQNTVDGGWSFDHRGGYCNGRCKNPGSLNTARIGATAIALLPFLGAGQTHKEGQYQKEVYDGLSFLIQNMKVQVKGQGTVGQLNEPGGRMYSHGLAAIALCEAYAMTKDRDLEKPAQLALNYIVYAQDPIGGGWRYIEHEKGDTSVVGWMLMALKSGHMGYLRVPKRTIRGANHFLDYVAADGGSMYGYKQSAKNRRGTTAVGLLCRMYLGWDRSEPGLARGVEHLDDWGPSKSDIYYNYYATQVMRHNGGEVWDRWNVEMRDHLVNTQSKAGHQTGSWFGNDHGSTRGGRLYYTAMATMVLEVYYRHMPIYGQQAAEEDFPL